MSGPKLGRPPKAKKKTEKKEYQDNTDRIEDERFFGREKHSFGVGLIVTKPEEPACLRSHYRCWPQMLFAPGTFSFVALYFCDIPEDYGKTYFAEFEPAD